MGRIPSLNLVYHDESFLWALASAIGLPVKVDLHTSQIEHGRYARVCVEIDLNEPVISKVGINGEWYQVQYVSLCTQCRSYDHALERCTPRPSTNTIPATKGEGG